MEKAEDSEGFDSCEEASDGNQNPFQDFNKQIAEVEDENLKRKCLNSFFLFCLLKTIVNLILYSFHPNRKKNDRRLHRLTAGYELRRDEASLQEGRQVKAVSHQCLGPDETRAVRQAPTSHPAS